MKRFASILAALLLIPAMATASEWSANLDGTTAREEGVASVTTTHDGVITYSIMTNGIGVPTRAVIMQGGLEFADLGATFNFGSAAGVLETGLDLSGLPETAGLTLRVEGDATIEGPLLLQPGGDVSVDPLLRINFGDISVGSSSALRRIRVTNDGDQNLRVARVVIRGANRTQYAIDADTCAQRTLAPGEKCLLRFSFRPTTTGELRALAVVISSDENEADVRVQLRGNGT